MMQLAKYVSIFASTVAVVHGLRSSAVGAKVDAADASAAGASRAIAKIDPIEHANRINEVNDRLAYDISAMRNSPFGGLGISVHRDYREELKPLYDNLQGMMDVWTDKDWLAFDKTVRCEHCYLPFQQRIDAAKNHYGQVVLSKHYDFTKNGFDKVSLRVPAGAAGFEVFAGWYIEGIVNYDSDGGEHVIAQRSLESLLSYFQDAATSPHVYVRVRQTPLAKQNTGPAAAAAPSQA
jgi:hypothetical protein